MGIFHAYDIRGVFGDSLTPAIARRIGNFLPRLLQTREVLVGRDARKSSPILFDALCDGLTSAGANVTTIGLCTTPMVYFASAHYGFDAAVCITASHNPAQYNGFKICTTDSRPIGYDTGLGQLEQWVGDIAGEPLTVAAQPGTIVERDIRDDYLNFLQPHQSACGELSLAIDCANGMAGLLAEQGFGPAQQYLFEQIDCSFPNHPPDPSNPDNLQVLREAVISASHDLGIVFDGDADRVMFLDENGDFVPPDFIIAVLGKYFHLTGHANPVVLQDVRTSRSVAEFLARFGATVHTWKVGRAFAASRLRELDGVVGGELAGHYYFRDFSYSDSAMLAALRVLHVVAHEKRAGRTFSMLIDEIARYCGSGEINFTLQNKPAAMAAVRDWFLEHEAPQAIHDFDGYRLEFPDWWFCIRQSNTEPLLRLVVEAREQAELTRRIDQISTIINQFAGSQKAA